MANNESMHRCVTRFMLDTCRYSTNEYAKDAAFVRFLTSHALANFSKHTGEAFMSGSSAEICIRPMLSCIGDIDVMGAIETLIAIPQGYSVPTELPSHYQHTVLVYEIIDSHKPGFVYLQRSCLLRKTDTGRYLAELQAEIQEKEAIRLISRINYDSQKRAQDWFQRTANQEVQGNASIQSLLTGASEIHGPALNAVLNLVEFYKPTHRYVSLSNFDIVACIRCLPWPPQANNWPTRKRNNFWPDAAIINVVVSNGCDVVRAVHPLCKQDEWMSTCQWRLSFSRAEVTLLNSWTQLQQITYHMLRFVMKRAILAKTNDKDQDVPNLSNYHTKTLMLWECEQKPQSFWSADSSLIKICSSLLHKLTAWVSDKCCPHYFVSDCNILDHFVDDASSLTIVNNLKCLMDETVLLSWFVENYIRKCAECCPTEVLTLFEDISSCDQLEKAVQGVIDWKWSNQSEEIYMEHYKSEAMIHGILLVFRIDATATPMFMQSLQNFDLLLQDYFVALTSLWAAYTISMNSLTKELLEILWTLFDPCDAAVGVKNTNGGYLSIRRAVKLACLNNIGSNAMEMLYGEMSKAYMHQFLACEQESTCCVVHLLLAALYYKSGHYPAAVHHCEKVLNQTFSEHHGLPSIGAQLLPLFGDNVETVFGLVLLYDHVQRQALHPGAHPQQESKPAFTPELLALYLYSQCNNVPNAKWNKLTKYLQPLSNTKRPHLCDVLLFKDKKMQLAECSEIPADDASHALSSTDTSLLVIALELVALEKLTTFRQTMVRELHSEHFPILNEFEALYTYRCGLFEECLEICRNHVHMLLRAGCSRSQRYVIALPQFVSMLDGELVSLFGVVGILHPIPFLLMLQFPDYEAISVLTLSLYLMVQCQKILGKDAIGDTLQLIRFVHDKMIPADDDVYFVDRLILKLTYRSAKLYIDDASLSIPFTAND